MNTVSFLQQLSAQGIRLWPAGEQLRYQAPEASLTPDLLATLKEHKVALLAYLNSSEIHPLSYGQQGIWFDQQMAPQSIDYHVSVMVRIYSTVDVGTLRQAFQMLLERHAALRTTFEIDETGKPQQHVHHYQLVEFRRIDASEWSWPHLNQQAQTFHAMPFNLTRGPLFHVALFTRQPDDHLLIFSTHHLVIDGWTISLILDELHELYRAAQQNMIAALPQIDTLYVDYVTWQRDMLVTEGEQLLDYWREQLAGELPLLNLPTDRPHPPTRPQSIDTYVLDIPTALQQQLRAFSHRENITLYTLLLTAYQILLYRYTGQEDVLVGSPTSGRTRPEFTSVVGYLVSPIVVRTNFSSKPTVRTLLQQVKQTVLDGLVHQDYPFSLLVENLQPRRDPGRLPVYQTMFQLQRLQPDAQWKKASHVAIEEMSSAFDWNGLMISSFAVLQNEAQYEIYLDLVDTPNELQGFLSYNPALFDADTMARMAGHYQILLEGMIADPTQSIVDLPLLTPAEQQQILVDWNATTTDYPKDKCVHQLFEEQVMRTPNEIAIVFYDSVATSNRQPAMLTYYELNEQANQLAHYLRAHGAGPDVLVGLCLERSLEMIVGLLAILKTGAAYVPLDAAYPLDRLSFMLADTQAPLLLTQTSLVERLPASAAQVVCLDADWAAITQQPLTNLDSGVTANNLIYVMYTSGSTGRPKGISIEHRSVVRLVKATNYVELNADIVMLQYSPISFDAATLELWGSLLNGGRLIVPPAGQLSMVELGQFIRQRGVNMLWLTAGLFHMMVDQCLDDLRSVRQLAAGGDVLSVAHVKRVLTTLTDCTLINGYGPTENTTFTCCYPMKDVAQVGTSVPIGRPIANTQVYILDPNLQPLPIGVPGELLTGGVGLAREYLHQPELTTEKFIPNPFGIGSLYRTGDLARWLPDGNIEYLGRSDDQVKLRGFRIELGEIEAVLLEHPAVQDAVVVAHQDATGEKQLVAYAVAVDAERNQQAAALRQFLRQKLPGYMVPANLCAAG